MGRLVITGEWMAAKWPSMSRRWSDALSRRHPLRQLTGGGDLFAGQPRRLCSPHTRPPRSWRRCASASVSTRVSRERPLCRMAGRWQRASSTTQPRSESADCSGRGIPPRAAARRLIVQVRRRPDPRVSGEHAQFAVKSSSGCSRAGPLRASG
jgi:hypothetical protein